MFCKYIPSPLTAQWLQANIKPVAKSLWTWSTQYVFLIPYFQVCIINKTISHCFISEHPRLSVEYAIGRKLQKYIHVVHFRCQTLYQEGERKHEHSQVRVHTVHVIGSCRAAHYIHKLLNFQFASFLVLFTSLLFNLMGIW